jgi:hypothetical protein
MRKTSTEFEDDSRILKIGQPRPVELMTLPEEAKDHGQRSASVRGLIEQVSSNILRQLPDGRGQKA